MFELLFVFCLKIVKGLKSLHNLFIFHRDLKVKRENYKIDKIS